MDAFEDLPRFKPGAAVRTMKSRATVTGRSKAHPCCNHSVHPDRASELPRDEPGAVPPDAAPQEKQNFQTNLRPEEY